MSAITPLYKFFSDPIIDNFLRGQVHHHIKGLCNWFYILFFIYQGKEIHEIRLVTERAKMLFQFTRILA